MSCPHCPNLLGARPYHVAQRQRTFAAFAHHRGSSLIADLKSSLPGVALCVAVTAVAKLIEQAEVGYAGHPYLEGLVVAILLGVLIRAFWAPGPVWWHAAIRSAATRRSLRSRRSSAQGPQTSRPRSPSRRCSA